MICRLAYCWIFSFNVILPVLLDSQYFPGELPPPPPPPRYFLFKWGRGLCVDYHLWPNCPKQPQPFTGSIVITGRCWFRGRLTALPGISCFGGKHARISKYQNIMFWRQTRQNIKISEYHILEATADEQSKTDPSAASWLPVGADWCLETWPGYQDETVYRQNAFNFLHFHHIFLSWGNYLKGDLISPSQQSQALFYTS